MIYKSHIGIADDDSNRGNCSLLTGFVMFRGCEPRKLIVVKISTGTKNILLNEILKFAVELSSRRVAFQAILNGPLV